MFIYIDILQATCININYSDAGLFGFQVVGQASDMDKIIKSVMATFGEATKGNITDADVQRAKWVLIIESYPAHNVLIFHAI